MASQKHLHELLKEDQEPFRLKTYINEKRSQFKRPINNTTASSSSLPVQVKKRKETLTTTSTISAKSMCKHACFLSFNDSPDVRKSPFPDFRSPAKSPCKGGGTVYLHVPARTAALLLEAAMRIQKQQSLKPKSHTKTMGFGMFSSLIKKLKERSRSKKCEEIRGVPEFEAPRRSGAKSKTEEDAGCSCSGNNSRLSSAGWSESNEGKSLDMETCTSSCRSPDSENCGSCENNCSSSPSSPFRFSLQKSPFRSPDSSSPAASPCRRSNEENSKNEGNQLVAEGEEREQCSPVSVLGSPFEDEEDDNIHEEEQDDEGEDEDYEDMDCSFAFMQRAQEQLLLRLRRFEKLAELDPVELEKRMMEQLEEDDEDESEDQDSKCEGSGFSPLRRSFRSLDSFVNEVCTNSRTDMKKLVSDLITEDKREFRFLDSKDIVVGRVCKKLDSWKDVESNTIDMMVESDFINELDVWRKFQEERDDAAVEIEFAIFGELMDQLSEELH